MVYFALEHPALCFKPKISQNYCTTMSQASSNIFITNLYYNAFCMAAFRDIDYIFRERIYEAKSWHCIKTNHLCVCIHKWFLSNESTYVDRSEISLSLDVHNCKSHPSILPFLSLCLSAVLQSALSVWRKKWTVQGRSPTIPARDDHRAAAAKPAAGTK